MLEICLRKTAFTLPALVRGVETNLSPTNSNRVVIVVILSVYSVALSFEFVDDFISAGNDHQEEWMIDFIRLMASAKSKALTIRERFAH